MVNNYVHMKKKKTRAKHLNILTESAIGTILSRVDEGADEPVDLSSSSNDF